MNSASNIFCRERAELSLNNHYWVYKLIYKDLECLCVANINLRFLFLFTTFIIAFLHSKKPASEENLSSVLE